MTTCGRLQGILPQVVCCLMAAVMALSVVANLNTPFLEYIPFNAVCAMVTLLPLILAALGYGFSRVEYFVLGVVGTVMSECVLEGNVLCFGIMAGALAWTQWRAACRTRRKAPAQRNRGRR